MRLRVLGRWVPTWAGYVLAFALAGCLVTATVIGAVDSVFRTLPHESANRVVYLRHHAPAEGIENLRFSIPELRDYGGVPALRITGLSMGPARVEVGDAASRLPVAYAEEDLFEVVGLRPVLGRLLVAGDGHPTATPVVVLSHTYWLDEFGGDPRAVGSAVSVDGVVAEVVGVVEPALWHLGSPALFANYAINGHYLSAAMVEGREHRMTEAFARLTRGATRRDASRQLAQIADGLVRDYAEVYSSQVEVEVVPLRRALMGDLGVLLPGLILGGGLATTVAWLSIGIWLRAGAIGRRRESAIRIALGASPIRLAVDRGFQLLLAGTIGTILGVGVGVALTRSALGPLTFREASDGLGAPSLAALCALLNLAVVVGFALWEGSSGVELRPGSDGVRRRGYLALMTVQAAVVVSAICVAIQSAQVIESLERRGTGADLAGVSVTEISLPEDRLAQDEVKRLHGLIQDSMLALPEVVDAALGSTAPLIGNEFELSAVSDELESSPASSLPRVSYRAVSPRYFRTLRIPVVEGRGFGQLDEYAGEPVAVINVAARERLFPRGTAVGRHVAFKDDLLDFIPVAATRRRVVGVVGDTDARAVGAPPKPALYLPLAQEEELFAAYAVVRSRSRDSPGSAVARIIRDANRDAAVGPSVVLASIEEERLAVHHAVAWGARVLALAAGAVAWCAALALVVLTIKRDQRPIAIRAALGASSRQLGMYTASDALRAAGGGVMLGGLSTVWIVRFLGVTMFGFEAVQPGALLVAALAIVALVPTALAVARPGQAFRDFSSLRAVE